MGLTEVAALIEEFVDGMPAHLLTVGRLHLWWSKDDRGNYPSHVSISFSGPADDLKTFHAWLASKGLTHRP